MAARSIEARQRMSRAKLGKPLSIEHRKAIAASMSGKTWATERKSARTKLLQAHHPRSYTWVLVDQLGRLHIVKNIGDFCAKHDLAYSVLRSKAQTGDSSPVLRGKSSGWVVFGTTRINH